MQTHNNQLDSDNEGTGTSVYLWPGVIICALVIVFAIIIFLSIVILISRKKKKVESNSRQVHVAS